MSYPSKTEFDNLRNSLPLTYQTRGNYAFRTDLASNINTALRNVNTALAFYAKKTDIPIVPANVATKTDLAGYALASDLSKYQPAGRYVSPSELEAYQAKGDYALAKDLVSYAKSSDLANFQPKGEYALAADLASYAKESSLASYQPKGDYAVKSDLANFQPKGEYALAADLASYARQSSLASYQPKGDYALAKDLESYAVKTDLAGYQPKGNYQTAGNYALQTDLDGYQPKGSYALQTDLAGYQPKGNYQTAGNYALKTELANYALTKDFANLQPKGNYQTAGNYALQPTAGNYALQSELAGYVKTAGASTFSGQATFDKNAIVKTEGTTPFQVLGPGGLRVSGGNLTVTGALATFENNATVTTSAGKPFEVKGAGGIDVDGIGIAAAGTITGKGRLHITGPELLYVLNKDGLMIGKEWKGSGNLGVQGDTTISGNASIAGSLSGNSLFLESGLDPALRLGPGIRDTGNARLNVQDKTGSYMRFFSGTTETGSITQDSGTSLNVNKVNAGQVSTGNASITNLTIGNMNMTGAPTFSALATFKSNATVETTTDKPFQVIGKGGLLVTGGNLSVSGDTTVTGNKFKLGNATFVAGTDDWVRMSGDGGTTYNYGLAATNLLASSDLSVNGNAFIKGTLEANSVGINPTDGFIYGNNKLGHYGLKWANETGNKDGPTAFLSSYGGIKMFTQGGERVAIDADGNTTFKGGLSAPTGLISNLSSGNAEITNLTVGNFNLTGAPTFSGLATLKGNATVTTLKDKQFEVTGPGGLKVNGPVFVPGGISGDVAVTGNQTITGKQTISGEIETNNWNIKSDGSTLVFKNRTNPITQTWLAGRGENEVVQAKLNNDGILYNAGVDTTGVHKGVNSITTGNLKVNDKVSAANAEITNLTIGNMSMTGAPTFSALATFKSNATVETTDSKPFEVTGKGGLRVTGGNFTVTGAAGVGTNGSVLISGADAYGHALYVASSSAAGKRLGLGNTGIVGNVFAYDYASNKSQNLTLQGPGGNVGIGTDSPSDKLHVNGGATVEGASTFKALATFEKNATVTTTDNNPFKITGAGGLKVDHTKLKLGNATFVAGTDDWVRMTDDAGTFNYGLAGKNLYAASNITASIGGDVSHIRTPNGELKMNRHGIQLGGDNNKIQIDSAQISAGVHVKNSLNIIGMGTENANRKIDMWAEGGLNVYGSAIVRDGLSANHLFLESGGDPSLRLGPAIKDTGNARLNVQDKAGTYMRFFRGATETGSITTDGTDSTILNVNTVNAKSANINGSLNLNLNDTIGGVDLKNGEKGNGGIYMANGNGHYTTDANGGDMIIRNNKGTLRFVYGGGGSAMTVDSNNMVNFPGGLKIGNWLLYQHSNGNLHFRNTAKDDGKDDYGEWDFVLDGATRKKLYTHTIDTSDTSDLILQNRNRDDSEKVTQFKLGGNGVIYQDFHQWGNKKNNWIVWNG